MERSRIERALRSRPSDEPVYRAQPVALDTRTGARGGVQGIARGMAVGAAAVAIVALVGATAFLALTPVFGPAGDPLPALCSPDRLDLRVVQVTEITGTRRIDTELENLGETDCAVPRAMHVRVLDRAHDRVPADSELTALNEGREHLVPGLVRLPSGSVARGVIEWTNLCTAADTADLWVQAFLSEDSGSPGVRIETPYDRDGQAGVPACRRPESMALMGPLTITDVAEVDEWGPLAVTSGPRNGDLALATGVIRISDECVVLESAGEGSTLLVWSSEQASWDPQERQVLVRTRAGEVIGFRDGDQVGFGGSGRALSMDESSPEEWDGLTWDDWLPTIDWVAAPDPTCRAGSVWFIGEVVVDRSSPPVVPASPSQRLEHPIVISNGTTRPITLLIDGQDFLTVPAESGATVPVATIPRLPFELEARLPSGQVIGSRVMSEPEGSLLRVSLTCGVLDVWSGATQPLGPRPDPADDIEC